MSFYEQFAAHYEKIFPFREATWQFLRSRLPDQGRILDLGCGPGHYAGRFAAEDRLTAWGIDLDPAMVQAARENYPAAQFAVLDLRLVANLESPFTGAYCIGNVLPHLPEGDLDPFLAGLALHLPDDAVFVVQTVNFDRLLPLAQPYRFPDLDAGAGLVFRREYVPAEEGVVRFLTELREDDRVLFAGEETLWPMLADVLAARCEAAGFAVAERCGDFTGAAFDPAESGALVLVLRRRRP